MPRYDVYHYLNLFSMSFTIFMVVILIFYMVVTPIIDDEPMIPTPYAWSAEKAPGFERDLNIGLTKSGLLTYRNRLVSRSQVVALFRNRRRDLTPRIYAETGTEYRYVRGVVRAAQEAGVTRLTFMARPCNGSRYCFRQNRCSNLFPSYSTVGQLNIIPNL